MVVGAPSLLARLTGPGVHPGEVVRVELAGSGAAVVQVTGGDRQALAAHRRLVMLDNAYVAAYPVPLVLGIGLLPPPWRQVGVGLTGVAAVADLIENAALVGALDLLATHPTQPQSADGPARRARRAALVKFSALVPAAGLALWGTTRTLRPGPDH